jgi:ganglioside GM2 activator
MGVLTGGQLAVVFCASLVLQGHAQQNGVHHMSNKERKVFSANSFSWKDCGEPALPGHVKNLILNPDPLDLPGNISVGFSGLLNINLASPIVVDVEVQKKVVFWITVPCIEHVGSCNYPDACPLLEKLNCPPIFTQYGIPCKCPITAATYNLPPSIFYVDDSFLPSVLTNGEYKVTVNLSQNDQKIGCLYIEFQITR